MRHLFKNMVLPPALLMIRNYFLPQLSAVIDYILDAIVARVASSVPDDHPKNLWLTSYGITEL